MIKEGPWSFHFSSYFFTRRDSDPRIDESYVTSALRYVELAEEVNGPIPRPVDFAYVWGDALAELERVAPDVRIINLETAVTKSNDCWHNGDKLPDAPGEYSLHHGGQDRLLHAGE